MTIPLQKTKFFIPPARAQLIGRPRLTGRLDGLLAEGCRAGLISAPAGSGKTTLVVQWLGGQEIQAAWLSLDARDNAPARFFAYLIATLQAIAAGTGNTAARIGSEALSLLDLPGADPEEIITLLTNDLADVPGPILLVLDDYHTITNPLLHQAIDFLIEAQPPQMRLVLLSREDPALQLARRRARGQLVEIRHEDLRFTLAEAIAFLNQTMNLSLTSGQVEILEARTEGWIAGLQMAALALQAIQNQAEKQAYPPSANVERFLNDFSGSHRFILDYLVEEVLVSQPMQVQHFLLDTAILERMCPELCAAVTCKTNAETQALLEQLARENLFVIPLDGERHWYRYHHLFHDLLLARLKAANPSHIAELERRASDWYEENGEPRLAVECALKAQDPQRAAELLDRHINERWQTLDLEFHLNVKRLPLEVMLDRPTLCLQRAWMAVIMGPLDQVLPFVEAAERALAAQDQQSTTGGRSAGAADENRQAHLAFARALRAYVKDNDNQPVELDESLHLALSLIPIENVGMRNSVAVVIGTIYFMEGDFATAIRFFEEALEADMRVNGTNAVPVSITRIAMVLQAQGQLREAERRLRQSEAYVRERGARRFYISGAINLLLGDILLEWNRLEEAEAQILEGFRLMEDWPIPQIRCLSWTLLARLRIAQSDGIGARDALGVAAAIHQPNHLHPIYADAVEHTRVLFLMMEQNSTQQPSAEQQPALEAWARTNEPQLLPLLQQPEIAFRYEARLIDLSRVWLALGRISEASGLLERLALAAQNRGGSRVNILILLAAARIQEMQAALVILEEALRLAEPEGYVRAFINAGEPLRRLLETWLQKNRSSGDLRLWQYAQRVLSAIEGTVTKSQASGVPSAVLPEPLSQREQEVLQMVAKGLTNQQIADRLVLSVRTVKKHIENIHGKLGVQNRTQAVARARELGLVG